MLRFRDQDMNISVDKADTPTHMHIYMYIYIYVTCIYDYICVLRETSQRPLWKQVSRQKTKTHWARWVSLLQYTPI